MILKPPTMKLIRLASKLLPLLILSSCDITPVSVGNWDITIESSQSTQRLTWSITEEPTLTILGDNPLQVEELDLSGSRITWSTADLDLPGTSNNAERANFRGTVDGNRLAGTIFTQKGNYTVYGMRK